MKIWQRMSLCTAVILLALWPAGGALAASVSGRASTVIEWFDDGQGDTAIPAYQYLLFNAKDLDGAGLNFRGYGRFGDDLKNEVDADHRLYFAYLEKDDALGALDFKLGRQFISTTAGASLMDGLHLDYDDLGPFGLKLFGGGDVAYYEGYNAEDLIAGAEISGHFFDSLHLGLSYLQKWDGGDLAHEFIGFDFDYDYAELLNLYSETQYSWLSDEVTYFLAGVNYRPDAAWRLRGEYLYSLPVFSSTSIYSVFSVAEYQELLAELNYRIATGLNAFVRYTLEMYEDYADADVYEAGLEKIRTDRFSGYLTGIIRDDEDGQDLEGFKIRAAYLFHPAFQLGVGVHLDVLERRLEEDDETTSRRYWVDATTELTKTVNLEGKVELIKSDLWDEYYRGRVRLNILF